MKALVVILSVLVAASVAYGVFGGHVRQWMRDAKESVDEASSDRHLAGIAEEALTKAGAELKEQYVKMYRVQEEIARQESALQGERDALAREDKILKRALEILEKAKQGSKVTIGQAEYTLEEVNSDVNNRLTNCKGLHKTIQWKEESLAKLKKAYADGMDAIRQKKEELNRKQSEFEAQKAELAALRTQQTIAETIGKVSGTDLASDLGKAQRAFDDRLKDLRARSEFDQKVAPATGRVGTWDAELGAPPKNAVDEVRAYFQGEGKAGEKAAAPAPPVEKALESLPEKR